MADHGPHQPKRRNWRAWLTGPSHLAASREALLSLEAKIKPDFKVAVASALVALVCLAIGVNLGGINRHGNLRWLVIGLTIAFAVLSAAAIRSAAREISRITKPRAGFAAASALRTLCLVIGALIVLLGLLQLLDIDLRNLLVGGAVTGIVLGIAAQQVLANFFAGLVLLFARPYVAGQYVKIRSGALGGPFEGTIVYAGLMYTTVDTVEGTVNLPNAALLGSAIGPVPAPPREHDPDSYL